jgi:hypothetical protein
VFEVVFWELFSFALGIFFVLGALSKAI